MANRWTKLLGMLPREATQVGEVVVVNGDGTCTVALIGGGRITATGTGYSVGTPVYVKGGVIRGQAPSTSVVDIPV